VELGVLALSVRIKWVFKVEVTRDLVLRGSWVPIHGVHLSLFHFNLQFVRQGRSDFSPVFIQSDRVALKALLALQIILLGVKVRLRPDSIFTNRHSVFVSLSSSRFMLLDYHSWHFFERLARDLDSMSIVGTRSRDI